MAGRWTGMGWLVLAGVACGGTQVAREDFNTPVMTQKGPDGTVQQTTDLDGDGQPDVWTSFREQKTGKDQVRRVMVHKAVDLNRDGRVDIQMIYDDQGDLVREELDLDFDGRADVVRHYRKGKLEREDVASRFDGRIDIRKFYEDGVLVVKQVDTARNGHFDEFQYFLGNRLARVGWDRDGDGKPEVFEENPAFTE